MGFSRFEYLRGNGEPGQPTQPRRERTLQEKLADQYRSSTPQRRAVPLSDGQGHVIGGTGGTGRDALPYEISSFLATGVHEPGDAPISRGYSEDTTPSYRTLAMGRASQRMQEFSGDNVPEEAPGLQSILKQTVRRRTQEFLDGTRTGSQRSPKHPKGERRDKGGRPRGSRR